jgi:putative ABC transport system substrate-binding protein
VSPLGGQDGKDIERTVTEFARGSNCGLISLASPLIINNRNLIISLAARHRLPAVYPFPSYGADGALICYGPDPIDPHRKAAGYVDRILKGEKPADLPVQAAIKFELRTSPSALHMSAFGGKADMAFCTANVRF